MQMPCKISPPPKQSIRLLVESVRLSSWKRYTVRSTFVLPFMDFQDVLPVMLERLGPKRFMEELLKGFDLLADPSTSTVTIASLKRNSEFLGLEEVTDEEVHAMVVEGDLDGDGALNHYEFCIQIIKASPSMRAQAEEWLEEILLEEADEFLTCNGQTCK
eukprot:c53611_g1_i1 orf=168-647(+)